MLDKIIKELNKQYDEIIYEALKKYCGIEKEELVEYMDRIETIVYPNGDKTYVLDNVPMFIVRMTEDKGMFRLEARPIVDIKVVNEN